MQTARPHLFVVARAESALRELYGISMVERLLRTVQRLGFRKATIVFRDAAVHRHLAQPSWARAEVALTFVDGEPSAATLLQHLAAGTALVVDAGFYFDARLLAALAEHTAPAQLVDSESSQDVAPASLVTTDWLAAQSSDESVLDQLSLGVEACDAAKVQPYIVSMRRNIRPVFFPASYPAAEEVLRRAAQKGTLDFPAALFDPPLQDRIVRMLSRTSITPNQTTQITAALGLIVTALFATGHLWLGFFAAFAVEVLDGVDGKLARTKVETTAAGDWEHVSDYFIELSWWLALAFHFFHHGLRSAFAFVALLVIANWIDLLSRSFVKKRTGRDIDDSSNFDRFVRCIGARRNVNVWILAMGLVIADPMNAFIFICGWTAATAAVHVVRALQLQARAA